MVISLENVTEKTLSCEEIGVVTVRHGHWAPVSIIAKDTHTSQQITGHGYLSCQEDIRDNCILHK